MLFDEEINSCRLNDDIFFGKMSEYLAKVRDGWFRKLVFVWIEPLGIRINTYPGYFSWTIFFQVFVHACWGAGIISACKINDIQIHILYSSFSLTLASSSVWCPRCRRPGRRCSRTSSRCWRDRRFSPLAHSSLPGPGGQTRPLSSSHSSVSVPLSDLENVQILSLSEKIIFNTRD